VTVRHGRLECRRRGGAGPRVPKPRLRHLVIVALILLGSALSADVRIGGVETLPSASAHRWGCWHWHVGGPAVYIGISNTAVNYWPAEYARRDIEARAHPVYLTSVNYHTNISVFDDYYGATGWSAIANVWPVSAAEPCHIGHAHARYNRSFTNFNIQGLFCQEIGHDLGLEHSNVGECMGYTYYPGYNVNPNALCFGTSCSTSSPSHSTVDLYNMYRYH
jgi:hypothetical protein